MTIHLHELHQQDKNEPNIRYFTPGSSPVARAYEGMRREADGELYINLRVSGKAYKFLASDMLDAMNSPDVAEDATSHFNALSDGEEVRISLLLASAQYLRDRMTAGHPTLMDEIGFKGAGYGHWQPHFGVKG